MTTVPVLWVTRRDGILARGYADQGLLEGILDRSVWRPPAPLEFEHHELVHQDFPDVDGAVVIINARTHAAPKHVAWLNTQLGRLRWAVLLLCGDEEWIFPWQKIEHPNIRVWAMQPRPEHAHLGLLPGGWYPKTFEYLADCESEAVKRPRDWFFAGQVNHERREACVAALRGLDGGELHETAGYLQEAVTRPEYFRLMAAAKVIPCPSGPYSTDCARTFEALEAGCIPVADLRSIHGPVFDYWALLFGPDHRFPTIEDWSTFPKVLAELLREWPANANRVYARWQQWKRSFAHRLDTDIRLVSGANRDLATSDDQVTVIVTTSPVPRHPSTDHIEEVLDSIRAQLPAAEIIVVADAVRPELKHRRDDYEEYLRRLLWLCNFRWPNVVPVVLDEWGHQANATRAALELVTTPLVLFVEHDTPLVGDIPWTELCAFVGSGEANAVRLHQDVDIHADHERVMLDHENVERFGIPVRRTAAWWQRPHLASTHFYRHHVMPRFPESSRTMIEDRLYADVWGDWENRGEAGWWDWRVWVFTPEGDMRRSGHLDSREDDPKFPMEYGSARRRR